MSEQSTDTDTDADAVVDADAHSEANAMAPRIVSIEDNPGDIRLIEEAISTVDGDIELVQYSNATDALAALTASDDTAGLDVDLLLLDMNIPGKSGLEILTQLRTESSTDSLPIVVVSSSENPEDIRRVYEESANAYIKKPADPDEFIQRIRDAVRFWVPATREDN